MIWFISYGGRLPATEGYEYSCRWSATHRTGVYCLSKADVSVATAAAAPFFSRH